ncbi:hypothetical protein T265_01248 [Opisthorchis viverrini]|uniref:Ndr family protein n=1 Tax=Opisthorchis viverrini TaxID=6198 RepID=A0A075AAH0_OPIVI|nr:hypothetical protein T265_01248 [Opisthorchis viverrini]KER32765.1 hypothetical protein T265_01248 [Opisthorchis viverrini]
MEVVSVPTEKCGIFTVYIQGVKPKNAPVIVTIPDLGCNHEYYANFVNAQLPDRFCWCHIELPGQSFGSHDWTTDAEDAGETEETGQGKIAKGIQQAVLFGEGAGANLLARVAILYDSRVLGALFIHGRCSQSGPLKLLRAKMRSWKSSHLEPATERYLLEHRFSTVSDSNLMEPLKSVFLQYKENLNTKVNAKNLNYLTYSYAQCPVLLITGTKSDHRSGVRHMYETMNKIHKTGGHSRTTVEMVEIEDSLSPLVDRSDKVAETALYFLQGLGIVTFVKSAPRKMSGDGAAGRLSWTGSPEKRTCEELKNLDLTTDHLTCSGDICRKQSDGSETSPKRLPPRYFSRQLSMAELDLPRGPGALITGRAIPPSCCPRNPSMDSHRRPSVEHSQH